MSAAKKCCFQKSDGTACQAAATASGYCFFHDGNKAAEAGKKGGRSRKRPPAIFLLDAEDVPLATVGDVVKALASTFNKVQKGQLDPKTGNCLALISGQLLRAMQEGELAAELEAMRTEMEAMKHERGNAAATSAESSPADSDAAGGADAPGGANQERSSAGDDLGGDEAGPMAGEALEGEMESSLAPLFETERQEPDSRSAGAG